MNITGDFHSQDDLARMRRVGQHIQQVAGVYGFQDHFKSQAAVLQALFVRVARKDAHFEISSIISNFGKVDYAFGGGRLNGIFSPFDTDSISARSLSRHRHSSLRLE